MGGAWVAVVAVLWGILPGWASGPGGQDAQADSVLWTWMKGSNTAAPLGTYGEYQVPAAANNPGGRSGAVSWVGSTGAFWVFGGYGFNGSSSWLGYLNDLWKYDPATGNWTWMKGSADTDQTGVYGPFKEEGESYMPGGRQAASAWTDNLGRLLLFGGTGMAEGNFAYRNDLWRFDPATKRWAWIKGSSTGGQTGTYGAPGVPASANTPGARHLAASWKGGSGALWLFGGYGYDNADGYRYLNDLWAFDPSTENWTWVNGSYSGNQRGTYGTPGVGAAANAPGARSGAVTWTDSSGMLWLFGGYGYDGATGNGYLSDLWKYDPATGNWTWVKGSSIANQLGVYGTQGVADAANMPGGHSEAVSWTDSSGALWLFGGGGFAASGPSGRLNDLWKFDRSTGNWTWMSGYPSTEMPGTYGTPGTPAPANMPGARVGANALPGASGSMWLFGGAARDSIGIVNASNDLWRMTIQDTTKPTGTIVVNSNRSVTNSLNATLSLTWSDGTGSGVVRMKFSNDGASWTAWEPLAATKAWTLPAGEGYHTVRAMFRDAAGNNSIVYSDYIRVD